MSLLGPDDFDLTKKERKKKLAKDLSPEVYKQVEKWIDKEEDEEALPNLDEIHSDEEALKFLSKSKGKK